MATAVVGKGSVGDGWERKDGYWDDRLHSPGNQLEGPKLGWNCDCGFGCLGRVEAAWGGLTF